MSMVTATGTEGAWETSACPACKLRAGLKVSAGTEGWVTILRVDVEPDGIWLSADARSPGASCALPVSVGPAGRIESVTCRRPWDAPAAA